eukprot:GILK01009626.1.p1 GENE.GILK01009626.1~~GILK01009626.1.p1  ORF type:complete len:535 (-),score=71.35 GILK01009626.1:226-1830(-)
MADLRNLSSRLPRPLYLFLGIVILGLFFLPKQPSTSSTAVESQNERVSSLRTSNPTAELDVLRKRVAELEDRLRQAATSPSSSKESSPQQATTSAATAQAAPSQTSATLIPTPREGSLDDVVPKAVEHYKLRYLRDPPPHFEKWVKYAFEHKCELDNYDWIEEDLKPFRKLGRKPITRQMFQRASDLGYTGTYRIKDGQLSVLKSEKSRTHHFWRHEEDWSLFVKKFVSELPNMEFVINFLDEPRILHDPSSSEGSRSFGNGYEGTGALLEKLCEDQKLVAEVKDHHGFFSGPPTLDLSFQMAPIFSQTKIRGCFQDIMVPSHYFFYEEHGSWRADAERENNDHPWDKKSPKLYWRGSTTGTLHRGHNWRKSHRPGLYMSAKKQGILDKMDVKFTDINHCEHTACNEMRQELVSSGRAPFLEAWEHKFVLDMDGNSWSRRFKNLMYSNSAVMKAGIFSEWFEYLLEDGKQLIRVKVSGEDLGDKLNYYLEHDDEAKKIAQAGSEFARDFLRYEDMMCYTYRTFIEYADLCDFTV